ncbi:MAG TPA: PAS domain S-box protein [Methanoregula sp.]|nr:PAS domain S-box protein [Methanoregula sp.]
MDRSVIFRIRKRPRLLALTILLFALAVLALNGLGYSMGKPGILPHLLYIPIILMAYFFPRRGILFASALALTYFFMVSWFEPDPQYAILLSVGQVILFVLVAAVVTLLTLRLNESEEKYRGVIERSSDIILLTDTTGKATFISPSVNKSLGINASDVVGKGAADFVHPDDMDVVQQKLEELKNGAPFMDFTVRIRKKDNNYIFINFHGTRIYENGEFAGMQIMGRDITEQMAVADAYRRANLRQAQIIDLLPDPTMAIEKTGSVVAWNRAMEVMSGLPASAVMGKGGEEYTRWIRGTTGSSLIQFVLRQDNDAIAMRYPNVQFEGNTVRTETEITRTDGKSFSLWVSSTPIFGEEGEVIGAIESLRDVTHQKKIARALKESRRYLDAIINTMPDPLFIKDHDHRFVTVNDSFCEFSGHSREELVGKTDHDIFRQEEAAIFEQKDFDVFRTRQGNENEEILTDSRGKIHTIVTKKALYVNASNEEFIVGVIRDITQRKKTEQALQLTLRKLNTLSSITRHDILNQLMGLRAFLELTKGRETDPEKAGFLKKADHAAIAIQRQIEFTKNYEDLGVKEPRWQDVGELFRSAVADLPLSGITIDARVRGLSVYADPLIIKVFYTLAENTLRHGGPVTEIGLSFDEGPSGLVLTYRDNGVGISDADKKTLFQKGFGKHTGLGLFLCLEILSITGITISENGTPGCGVRFEIHVPKGAYRFSSS